MSAVAASHYDTLELAVDATCDDIRRAYAHQLRRFASSAHTANPLAGEALDALQKAFKTLSDPVLREAYDRALGLASAQPAKTMPGGAVTFTDNVTTDKHEPRVLPFSFAGRGGEYFRIWVVNLLLTILTLGIYSAWAKVRREKYFHRNLLLDGSSFEYHGQPLAILKGRMFAVVLVIILSIAEKLGPAAYGITVLLLLPVLPWLAIKAFRFRARNSSYRGLHFGFDASYPAACKVFLGYGLLSVLTLGLAFPLFYRQLRKFLIDHLRYGRTSLSTSVSIRQIYAIFVLPGILGLALLAGIFMVGMAVAGQGAGALMALGGILILLSVMIVAGQLILLPYFSAKTTNAVWGSTALGVNHFTSHLPVGGYIGVYLSNMFAIVLSLGLLIPWARVRLAAYRARHLSLHMHDDLEQFLAGERQAVSALGDEAAEMLDLDLAL